MDKRNRAHLFRQRLKDAMSSKDVTKSKLSRDTNVDRSTIGQLLNDEQPRLPNSQLTADIALALGVSTDWLLGLTHRPERPGDIMAASFSLSAAERTSADEQLLAWHNEAAGYKVRHVPSTLPDIFKTKAMLDWEYASQQKERLTEAYKAMQEQLNWLSSGVSDYEIAIPIHELEACASGTSYYKGLDKSIRDEQLIFIANQCEQMFPRLRLFLFNAHTLFSAPVTIFGPSLAVIYVGQCYLSFREAERVKSLSGHFDWLVREATIDARDVPSYIHKLIEQPPQ